MIIFLLIYSHAAAGILGYLSYGWTEYRMIDHEQGLLQHSLVIFGLSVFWPVVIYLICREGAK